MLLNWLKKSEELEMQEKREKIALFPEDFMDIVQIEFFFNFF